MLLPVPPWIRNLRADGYRNPSEILDPSTLYGTETLCGDWNGQLLVLAKDFAPAAEVAAVARTYGSVGAWRHNDGDGRYATGYRTNIRLLRFMFGDTSLLDGRAASTCGVVYGSACFFLKDGGTSASLPGWSMGNAVWDRSAEVLNYVLNRMSSLRAIVCLGADAFRLVENGVNGNDRLPADLRACLGRRFGGSLPVYAVPHPSRGSNDDHERVWAFVRQDSGIDWIGRTAPSMVAVTSVQQHAFP